MLVRKAWAREMPMATFDNPTFAKITQAIIEKPITSVCVAFVLGLLIARIF